MVGLADRGPLIGFQEVVIGALPISGVGTSTPGFVGQAPKNGAFSKTVRLVTSRDQFINDFDLVSDREQAEAYRADDLAVIQSGLPKFIAEEANTNLAGNRRIFQTTKVPFTSTLPRVRLTLPGVPWNPSETVAPAGSRSGRCCRLRGVRRICRS